MNIDRATRDVERNIARLMASMETLQELSKRLNLKNVERIWVGWNGSVYVDGSYDLETYRHNRRVLYKQGWRAINAFVNDDGTRHSWLKKDGQRIVYVMDTGTRGSTCQLVEDGERTRKVFTAECR